MLVNSYCELHTWNRLYQPRLDCHKRMSLVVERMKEEEKDRIRKEVEREILLEEIDIQLNNVINEISILFDDNLENDFKEDYKKLHLSIDTYTTTHGLVQLKKKYKNLPGYLINDIDRCIKSLDDLNQSN